MVFQEATTLNLIVLIAAEIAVTLVRYIAAVDLFDDTLSDLSFITHNTEVLHT